ncbi:hypothetical protein [Pararobbsia silviterrae]|uniref:DUF2029 domain-containing protein n=1 Tax=Pararobbsia silviterrae TaxID=1792498 RepID=A0A494YBA8_9BURK|nr:hypothetical protein [Pararobbsia silviterrae]RKP59040.1 hypothetical protein D7S86_03770 [Pararobbsia silviterrae]
MQMTDDPAVVPQSPHVWRRAWNLNAPFAPILAAVLMPVLFGLYSVWLGADTNWDLTNYHIYNPYAFLHGGRLSIDLAPAGVQTYFNPLIDVPAYWMFTHWPSRVVGFVLGAAHGLIFVFLLGIARQVAREVPDADRYRVPLLLALACALTPAVVTGIGNSMGDDTSALFTIGGLFVLIRHWDALRERGLRAVLAAVCGGLIVGMGVGLKPTTGIYAVSACVALLVYRARFVVRLRIAFLFGVGVASGFAVTAGYWMFELWHRFGNPVFPQFSSVFPHPWLLPINTADPTFIPHGFLRILFFPFIFTLRATIVAENPVHQLIWPIAYVLFWIWAARAIALKWSRRAHDAAQAQTRDSMRDPMRRPFDARAQFVLVYVALGYVLWLRGFGIYRYTVAIEALLPIAVFVLLNRLWPYPVARRRAAWIIGAAAILPLLVGVRSWGHEAWADPIYDADVPVIDQPERATVVIKMPAGAFAWLVPFFPEQVAFAQIESRQFPASPAFAARLHEMAVARGGDLYAVVDGVVAWRGPVVARMSATAERFGLTRSVLGCKAIRWYLSHYLIHAELEPVSDGVHQCRIAAASDDALGHDAVDRALAEQAAVAFARNGFVLDVASCRPYRARIGTGRMEYQWCRLSAR